jgi:hypothetical protein
MLGLGRNRANSGVRVNGQRIYLKNNPLIVLMKSHHNIL